MTDITQPLWVLVGLQTVILLGKIVYRLFCLYRDYKNYQLNKRSANAIIHALEQEHEQKQF